MGGRVIKKIVRLFGGSMLKPDYYFGSVHEIDYDALWGKNIRGLIFDIDNTLTAFDSRLPDSKTEKLLGELAARGFMLALLTNNTNKRLNRFNETLRLPGFANALKPFSFGVKKALDAMGMDASQAAIIGDQLLSDVWAGKNSGIATVLVKPITERDFWFVKIKRLIENQLLKRYYK